ncbi:efflux RND transporter periplasmic adaptor subunit [Leptospira idonii]|uniref:Efflux RND transporter periplasmic adaptor subunit n=1 Tax=Leptospira idonii TaxID=1193500 RepID=A0A4R9LYF5_9LEPT|nr:efflux RND transporter periplasmic adaptor subunit [Leptospira idonii]TGN19340.1 efflux RND transporter periplasmic adaptor subunit [Leptospira idonii]
MKPRKSQKNFAVKQIPVLLLVFSISFSFCSKEKEPESFSNRMILIHPEPLQRDSFTSFVGQLKPWYEAPLYAQVSGYVKHWYKDYGAQVKKGELLADIQAPILDAEYSQAKAEWEAQKAKYDLADITANRYNALRESNAVSEQSVSVAKASQNAERSLWKATGEQVKKQKVFLSFKEIRAPFAGIVTQRNINVGEYVNKEGNLSEGQGQKNLFTVADIHTIRLFVSVPEIYVSVLKPGFEVTVQISQFRDRVWKAKFYNYSRGYDSGSQTVLAQFLIENKDLSIWPGSIANVQWPNEMENHSLSIPTSALVFDESGTRVATLTEDKRIHFKSIDVGKVTDRYVEIKSGLDPQDKVIQNPGASLLEDDLITDKIEDKTIEKNKKEEEEALNPAEEDSSKRSL